MYSNKGGERSKGGEKENWKDGRIKEKERITKGNKKIRKRNKREEGKRG